MAFKRNVLIVDDESNILNFLTHGLGPYQDRLNVHAASSGEEALQIIDAQHIALVVTDIRMPGMDGLELIHQAREKNPDARFIVMTAYGNDEALEKSRERGVIDYIRKPFEFEAFVKKIFEALKPARRSWAGKLHGFQLTDALQFVHMIRKSQAIRVKTEFGEESLIYMKDGEIVNAEMEYLVGEEAFYKIVALEGGEIESLPLPENVSTTIQRPLAALILEGMRLKDEAEAFEQSRGEGHRTSFDEAVCSETGLTDGANEAQLPAQPAMPAKPLSGKALGTVKASDRHVAKAEGTEEASPSSSDSEFYRLVDDAFDFYRMGDLPGARERWQKALVLRPDNRGIKFNLEKLSEKENM